MLTERLLNMMEDAAEFGFMTSSQFRDEHAPTDRDGSFTRKGLRTLCAFGFMQKRQAEVVNPLTSGTVPVYVIDERGLAHLALCRDDTRFLRMHPPCTRSWQNFAHHVGVTDFRLKLRRALRAQDYVRLLGAFAEHTVVNTDAKNPADRYALWTEVQASPKKIVCAPDAGLELETGGVRAAFYVESETGSDTPRRVAAKKAQGYEWLFKTEKWKRHFPQANGFRVILVAPKPNWRDEIRREMKDKPGAELWRYVSLTDLTVEKFLHGEIFYTTTDGPRPLVRPAASMPTGQVNGSGGRDGKRVTR